MEKTCELCGSTFSKLKNISKNNFLKQRFCSMKCGNQGKKKYRGGGIRKSKEKQVICACGCGSVFTRTIYQKGQALYFRNFHYYLNQDHFKDWTRRVHGLASLKRAARELRK